MGGRGTGSGFRAEMREAEASRREEEAATAAVAAEARTTRAARPSTEEPTVTRSKVAQAIIRAYNASSDIDDRVALDQLRDARTETSVSFTGVIKTLMAAENDGGAGRGGVFNDVRDRTRIMKFLNTIAPGAYEFRSIPIGRIPVGGLFSGRVYEWRLFKKEPD